MSYSRRCAEAPIGSIMAKANEHPDWGVSVSETSGELCLRWLPDQAREEYGHYIFGWIDANQEPDTITTSVSCYACPTDEADQALLKLIRSAK